MADESTVPDGRIGCATYTHARRHPMVLGQIGGWTPPFQLSMPQLAVLAASFLVEFQTWRFWAPHVPRLVALVLAMGVPCVLAWLVRRARVEGRSLARTVVGYLMLWARPRAGRAGGRPCRSGRTADLRSAWTFVAAGSAAPAAPAAPGGSARPIRHELGTQR